MNVTNQFQTWGESTSSKSRNCRNAELPCVCVSVLQCICLCMCGYVPVTMHVCIGHRPVFHPYVNTPICGCMCRLSPRCCECTVKLKFSVSCHFSHLLCSQLDLCMKWNEGTNHAQQPEEEQEGRGTASPHSLPMNHAHS